MTKPHEETWTFDEKFGRVECVTPDVDGEPLYSRRLEVSHLPETGRLAAQAPAMARLLLDLYTEGHVTQTGSRECVSCSCTWRERITGKPYEPRHYDRCELAAVLRAAGVLS